MRLRRAPKNSFRPHRHVVAARTHVLAGIEAARIPARADRSPGSRGGATTGQRHRHRGSRVPSAGRRSDRHTLRRIVAIHRRSSIGHYYVGNTGDVERAVGASASAATVTDGIQASVDYTQADAEWLRPSRRLGKCRARDAFGDAPAVRTTARFDDLGRERSPALRYARLRHLQDEFRLHAPRCRNASARSSGRDSTSRSVRRCPFLDFAVRRSGR